MGMCVIVSAECVCPWFCADLGVCRRAAQLVVGWYLCESVCSWMLLEMRTCFVEAYCCEWGSEALGLLCTNKKRPEALLSSNLGCSHPFLSRPSCFLSQGGTPEHWAGCQLGRVPALPVPGLPCWETAPYARLSPE